MGQPGVPDYEIASPRRDLDDVMSGHIDGGVEHPTRMFVQVPIEVLEDRGNTLKAALTAGRVGQEEHPLVGGRATARGSRSQCPRARILIEASTESEWVARCLEGLGHEVLLDDDVLSLEIAQVA